MMIGCSSMIMVTLLQLIFGVSQYQSSSVDEAKPNFEKKQHNNRISSKAAQTPSIFKINTDLVPDGRQNFNPWGGKKRSEVTKNASPRNYSVDQDFNTQDVSTQRQKRRLISPYGAQNEEISCEPGEFTTCDLKLYQTDMKMDNSANLPSEETIPNLIYNGIKGNVLYGMKKNFNSWGGKRYLDDSYPEGDSKIGWVDPKYKEGKVSTEFINQIRNSVLFTSRGSYKPHISPDFNTNLPENSNSDGLIDKSNEEDSSSNNALEVSPLNYHEPEHGNLNYVVNKRKVDEKVPDNEMRGKILSDLINGENDKQDGIYSSVSDPNFHNTKPNERDGRNSAETWDSDRSQNNVRNQATWKDKNFGDLLYSMRLLNPWKGENEMNDSKNYVSGSPNRNLRNFEPWAGKRSGFEPYTRFYIKYPNSAVFDTSNRIIADKDFSRNIRNFEAWGGKRNYYSWGGKRSGNYLSNIPKFKSLASNSANIVRRNIRSNPDTKLIFFKGNINTWVNKTRKLNSWGGKRKLNESLEM